MSEQIGGSPFPEAEYVARLVSVQQRMVALDIDILLFTTEPEIRYFSGFLTQFWQSPTRPWFLLVPQTGKPVAVIPAIGEACMRRGWLDDIRTWSAPHPTDDGISLLADTLNELLGGYGTIGMPKGRETTLRMPLANYEALLGKIGRSKIVDATDTVQALRQVKSELEIKKILHACRAASEAFSLLPSMIEVGDTEREIFRTFKRQCLASGADDVSYLVGGAQLNGYNDIIAPPKDIETVPGDILILDTGCVYDGYFCDFDRNFAFTTVDSATRVAYQKTHNAIDMALSMIVPGVTCAEIFSAMQVGLAPSDDSTNSVGRMGHGLGMQLTESPSVTPFDHTVMTPGMVMTLEPCLAYGDGKIMVHEENIVIRENGAELLSKRANEEIIVI